jgi:LuxR family maltose regulon positive regulatory protein
MGPDVDAALDSVMAAESAVHTFPSGSHHRRETLALVSATKGRVLLEHGDSDAARVALEVAIEAASESGLDAFGLELRGLAALAHVSDGHLRRAVQLVGGQPSDRVGAPGVPISSRAAALALAWVRVDEDDLDAAARLLDMVPQLASGSEGRLLQAVHAIVRARLLQASGHADLAGASVRAVRPGPVGERGTGWLDHALVLSESDSLLASGRPHEALALLETLGPCSHPGCALHAERARLEEARLDGGGPLPSPPMPLRSAQSLRTEVDSLLVAATRQLHDGDRDRAEHSLEAALQLAAPEHLRRPFLEAPPPVRALLDDTGRSTRLLHPTADKHARHRPEVPLTAREQEVLVHLAELLTTEEIGRAMFVSVNTVRSHVRSVLRKLDVTRRNEAVRRAWELGLLPQRPEL